MTSRSPVLARTLDNGLTVLLREAHDAPVASFWVWYRVGSRNELPGLTGVSHWVEHMQFKGTATRAKGAIFTEISRQGGVLNAMTSQDWTAYFETLPADRLDLALSIESDRMVNSLFDPGETQAERTVIISERQGAENSPAYLLYEEVVGAAFQAHPYRHMVVGYESDLRAIARDDLYGHYRRHYRPNNAFVVAVGDFEAAGLMARVEKAFGGLEPGPSVEPVRAVEPPQRGERRVTLRRPSPTAYLRVAFHTPAARSEDTAAILIADAILSGGKGMGLGGGGQMGRSSRLYRALVAAGLARSAGSDFELSVDPYLLMVAVTALPGVEPARIEQVVEEELARLAAESVSDGELARALKQVRAQYVYSREGVTNQAFWLGAMEMADRYDRADTLVEELERVEPADIQRVAATYLTETNRTVGWLLPEGDGGGAGDGLADRPAVFRQANRWFLDGGRPVPGAGQRSRRPFERVALSSGIVVLGQARPDDLTAVARIRIEAGAVSEPDDRPGLAAFTARAMLRGTARHTFEQINETTDDLGAVIGVDAGRHFAELSIRCLREDLPALLALAAEIVREPVFPAEEVEKVRNELLTSIREQDNDTRSVAERAMRRLIYPAGHPYRRRVIGEADSVAALTRGDLAAFHREHYGPGVMTVAVVGGVATVAEAASLIAERFGDWQEEVAPPAPVAVVAPPAATVSDSVVVLGKSQSDLAIGFPTLPRSHADHYALETANLILGNLGLMGRLGANVRDRQGLAYYVYTVVEPGREGSLWTARAGVNPANVARAEESVRDEVRRLRAEPVTDQELADAKSYMTGVLPLALETNGGVAATLLNIEYYDLGLDYIDRYPGIINALTVDELQSAAAAHLDPERLAVGVAGPPL